MGGVAGKKQVAEAERFGDEAAHGRDVPLQHRAFDQLGAEVQARVQLLPDAGVRPRGEILIRVALHIEARDLG